MRTFAILACAAALLACGQAPGGYPSGEAAKESLRGALDAAKQGNKRVIIEVGSDTCVWCGRLERFMADEPEVRSALEKGFVVVRLDYRNPELLSGYPAITGTPFLYVLEKDGTLLAPQATDPFESGEGYDRAKLLAFLQAWAPAS